MRRILGPLAAISICLAACGTVETPPRPALTPIGYLTLPRESGAAAVLGQLVLDQRVGRLYLAHTSNGALDVIDLKTLRLTGSVSGLKGIRGLTLTSSPDQVYTSDAGDGTVGVVDLRTMRVVKLIPAGGTPEAIVYDALRDVVVAAIPAAPRLVFIDRTLQRVVGSVSLPGRPDLMAVEPGTGQVFVTINDRDQVDVVDDSSQQLTTVLRGCAIKAPTGVAYDPDQNRLFVADHLVMSVIDVLLDHCLGSIDVGGGSAQLALNPHTHHLLAANAVSGEVSVIDALDLRPLGRAPTGPQTGGLAVDPSTDRVYVALPESGAIAVLHDP